MFHTSYQNKSSNTFLEKNSLRIIIVIIGAFIVKWLFIALSALFGVDLSESLLQINKMALYFNQNFHWTQIFVSHFIDLNTSFLFATLSLALTTLMLFLGSYVEKTLGSENYLNQFCIGILGSILFVSAVSAVAILIGQTPIRYYGYTGGISAIIVSYAMLYPNQKLYFFFLFPMKVKWAMLAMYVCMIFLGNLESFIIYTGGAIAGALNLYLTMHLRKDIPFSAPSEKPRPKKPPKSEFNFVIPTILSSQRDNDKTQRQHDESIRTAIQDNIDKDNELDRILAKISSSGMESLTPQERETLDKASHEI